VCVCTWRSVSSEDSFDISNEEMHSNFIDPKDDINIIEHKSYEEERQCTVPMPNSRMTLLVIALLCALIVLFTRAYQTRDVQRCRARSSEYKVPLVPHRSSGGYCLRRTSKSGALHVYSEPPNDLHAHTKGGARPGNRHNSYVGEQAGRRGIGIVTRVGRGRSIGLFRGLRRRLSGGLCSRLP